MPQLQRPPQPQQQSPQSNPLNGIIGAATDLAKGIGSTGQQIYNTGDQVVQGLGGATRVAADLIAHNNTQAQIDNARAMQIQRDISNRKTMTGDNGTFISAQQASHAGQDPLNNMVRPILSATGAVLPYVLPYGAITKAAAPLAPVIAKAVGGTGGKVLGKLAQYGAEAGLTTAASAPGAALAQVGQTGTFTPQQAGQAITSGVQNGLLVGGGHAVGDLANVGIKAAKPVAQATVKAVNESRPSIIASQHPAVLGYDSQYSQLAQQFDTLPPNSPARQQVSQAMAQNRLARQATQNSIASQISQGGFIKVPFNKDQTALPLEPTPQVGKTPITSKVKTGKPPELVLPTAQRVPLGNAPNHITPLDNTANNLGNPKNPMIVSSDLQRPTSTVQTGKTLQSPVQGLPKTNLAADVPLTAKTLQKEGVLPSQSPQNLTEQVPGIKTDSTPVQQHPLSPNNTPIAQVAQSGEAVGNRFTQGVKTSNEVSKEVRSQVTGQHVQRNTKDLISSVQSEIKAQGLKPALNQTLKDLSVPAGQTSDFTLAKAIEIAKAHDAIGTPEAQHIAANLYDQVSSHAVGKGQGAQILSMLARSSPAGLRNKALRDLKKAGVEITPALTKEVQDHINTIASLPEGKLRDFAIAVFQKAVDKHIPQSAIGNVVSLWKAGLLSGVKTQGGNLVSNATFAGLKKASDPLAAGIDKVISLGSKQRTIGLTNKGLVSGTGEGIKNGMTTMKTGIDMRSMDGASGKYEQHAELNFGNKYVQKIFGNPANLVFRGMNAADQPFYYSALKNSMYDQAKADGLTQGLHGRALQDHMNNIVQNPTEKIVVTATKEANKSVLNYDTGASIAIAGAKQAVDRMKAPNQIKSMVRGTLDVLAPFTKVPSAFLSRTVDFTPLGIGKEVMTQVFSRQFDQRALSHALSEGVTGTGVIAIGMALANSGQLSGDYPTGNPKEAARWKAEGITANSVKIGGVWIGLNYMGPLGLLFGIGNNIVKTQRGGGGGGEQATQAIAGLGSGLLNQSFLQGFTGFTNAISDPARFAQTEINSLASSTIPAYLNDIGNATDSMQRQANNVVESIMNRVPGLRQTLHLKIDSFGNDLSQASGSSLNTALNPLKPSNNIDSPLLSELNRLSSVGNATFPLASKSIQVGKETVKLTPDQQNKYTKDSGQAIQTAWGNLINTAQYKALDDAGKSKYLSNNMADINAVVKKQTLIDIGRQDLADKVKLTTQQQALAANMSDSSKPYNTKVPGVAGSTVKASPATTYQNHLTAYNTATKDGTLTGPKAYSTQQSLAKEAVTSQYPQAVLDFYGMSKAQQNAYFAQDRTTATSLYNQAKQLDSQLVNKGLGTTKYKTAVTGSTAKVKTGRAKTGRVAKSKVPTGLLTAVAKSNSIKVPTFSKVKTGKVASFKAPSLKKYTLSKGKVVKVAAVKTRKAVYL